MIDKERQAADESWKKHKEKNPSHTWRLVALTDIGPRDSVYSYGCNECSWLSTTWMGWIEINDC